jgi:hypothetical protein
MLDQEVYGFGTSQPGRIHKYTGPIQTQKDLWHLLKYREETNLDFCSLPINPINVKLQRSSDWVLQVYIPYDIFEELRVLEAR